MLVLATLTGLVIDPHGGLMISAGGRSCWDRLRADRRWRPRYSWMAKRFLLPDGAQGAGDLRFSADGQHYAYTATFRECNRLVIDGAVQMSRT